MTLEDSENLDAILAKIPDEPEAEQPSAAETPSEQAEQEVPTEPESVEPEETPAIEPPQTWKAELKARWKDIPQDLQPVLAQWETERNQGVNSRLNESAEAKKAAEAVKVEAEQERQRYAGQLNTLIQQAVQLDPILSHTARMTQQDWDKLWNENPAQAGYLKHQVEQRVSTIQAWQQESQRLAAENSKKLQAQEESLLSDKLPDWRDEAKRTAMRTGILKTLQDAGYRPEELTNILDHRSVLVAHKAMLYDQMMAARQTAQTKREAAPAPKVVKPGNAQTGRGDSQQVAALKQRAMRSGKDNDVLAAIMAATKDIRDT